MGDRHQMSLVREGKVPPDKRVPFTPTSANSTALSAELTSRCNSTIRCFRDEEYKIWYWFESLNDCDIIMGIKVPALIIWLKARPIFFSHTIKATSNRKLLPKKRSKKIRLIDYRNVDDTPGAIICSFWSVCWNGGRLQWIVDLHTAITIVFNCWGVRCLMWMI